MAEKKRIEDGGPAFPCAGNPDWAHDPGMTLRDYFAGLAMQSFIAKIPPHEVEGRDGCKAITEDDLIAMRKGVAVSAVEQADAMIAALSNSDTEGE